MSLPKRSSIWSSSWSIMTSRSIWENTRLPWPHIKSNSSFTNSVTGSTTATLAGSSTAISNPKIYSSINQEPSKLLILDSLEHSAYLSRLSLMKLRHFGIGLPKFYLGKNSIVSALIFGQLVASLLNWWRRSQCSVEIVKSIKSSRFSNSTAPQLRHSGWMSVKIFLFRQSPRFQAYLPQIQRRESIDPLQVQRQGGSWSVHEDAAARPSSQNFNEVGFKTSLLQRCETWRYREI